MHKPVMLIVDLTSSPEETSPVEEFRHYFDIRFCAKQDQVGILLDRGDIDLVCFDFDYPDWGGLQFTIETKEACLSIPMLMTTVQHSEELAVWAFRNRLIDFLVKPVRCGDMERLSQVINKVCEAKSRENREVILSLPSPVPNGIAHVPPSDQRTLQSAINHVTQNYRNKIPNEVVAGLCGMSPFAFSRSFKAAFGMPFRDYVVRYRLREACRLLDNPNVNISDVAFAVGFNDVSYFSRMFKKHFGVSPTTRLKRVEQDKADSEEPDPSATQELQLPAKLLGDNIH
jgi:AraC-like DNA-binding protein